MVQYDHFRLEFAQSQNIQNSKYMPERSPSPESVLSDLDEVFLHEVDVMENKAPEMDTNDIDEIENISPEMATSNLKNIEPNRCVTLPDDAVQDFIMKQENSNTAKKAFNDIKLVKSFLQTKGEMRELNEIPPNGLEFLLSNFVLSIRKRDGGEFVPTSFRSIISSVDRRLKS